MGRALSWSLVAHAAFVVSFLLLSGSRQPLTLPQIVRPVRLVAYLEPAQAQRQRPAVAAPETARPAAAPPPAALPAALPDPAPAATPTPSAVQRSSVPVPAPAPLSGTPAPAAGARPALSERLARRLASATPAESRPAEPSAPQIASVPQPETAASAPIPERATPSTPASTAAVVPVGYFPHAWYLALLKEKIYARWSPPIELLRGGPPPAALVSFRIDRAGRVSDVAMKESSGSARFDRSALAAIQVIGQVPALPEQYREENLDVIIRFQNQR